MEHRLHLCHSNVGRSQMAEAYDKEYSGNYYVISAGNNSKAPEQYPRISLQILQLMAEDGIHMRGHYVKFVDRAMLEWADRILVWCKREECLDFVLGFENKITFLSVEDLYTASWKKMQEIRNIIREKVKLIL